MIAQPTNRTLWISIGQDRVDRGEIEDFESYCALRDFEKDGIPVHLDMQPGLLGFKSSILNQIIPIENNWLVDWHISLAAIRKTSYGTVMVESDTRVQQTTIKVEDQVERFRLLQRYLQSKGSSLSRVYKEYEERFEPRQKIILKKLVSKT